MPLRSDKLGPGDVRFKLLRDRLLERGLLVLFY